MIIQPANKLEHINEYYFSAKLKEIAKLKAMGKPIINLGIGNPDLPPSQATMDVLAAMVKEPDTHGYQSYIGTDGLRQGFADFYKTMYDVAFDTHTEILPLLGSKEGISFISNAFLNPGDKALVPNPGYPTYSSATYLAAAEPVYYNLDEKNDWLPNLDEIPENVLKEAKLMWVNYPNMPTGAEGNVAFFERLIAIAKKYNILICNDNPYSLILNNEQPMSIFHAKGAKEVCIELNSLSKSHNLAGARIGMVVGGEAYIRTILKVKSNVDSGMYLPVQCAAIAALSNNMEWHRERNEVYKTRREIAYQILDALHCTYTKNQVGMFLWAKIEDKYSNVEELTEKILHEANVFITPGFIFGANGARYIRISLCSNEEDLKETLRRILPLFLKS
jgi:aspartate/methionine/tyrosine aminotransferase